MENVYPIAIIIVLIFYILYLLYGQHFTNLYTSGARQRYASEFSSTNQGPTIYNSLAFQEHFKPKTSESALFNSLSESFKTFNL